MFTPILSSAPSGDGLHAENHNLVAQPARFLTRAAVRRDSPESNQDIGIDTVVGGFRGARIQLLAAPDEINPLNVLRVEEVKSVLGSRRASLFQSLDLTSSAT